LFDQALTETIIDYSDFDASKNLNWLRVEGGISVLTDAMHTYVTDNTGVEVQLNTPVVAMKDNGETITVTVGKTSETQTSKDYSFVFNTTALGCLQQMDIQGLNLADEILMGVRSLGYDRATKVAIKFSRPWWCDYGLSTTKPGGVSNTDLPISNVVYPSWYDGPNTPAVLMVSYSWAQDATRMGSLIPDYSAVQPTVDDQVVTLCLQNLVTLFKDSSATATPPPTYEMLRDMYITHHAWAWTHDPYTTGAFALFGRGQFANVYPAMQTPQCGGKFYMCGEATSVHHAWISGALDSAYMSALQWAWLNENTAGAAALKKSQFGGGEGQHPAEADETLLWWASKLGPGAHAPDKK
jgi:monoamine oxidase